nr:hypothetical protein 5 [Bacillaceae bacterium]
MAKQPETKVRFSVFNKEFNDGMKEMAQESTTLRKEFRLQEAQLKENGSETDILKNKLSFLSKEQDIAKKRVQATAEQLVKAKAKYGDNSKEAKKLSDQLIDLQTKEQNLRNDIIKTNRKIDEQGKQMQDTKQDAIKLADALEEVGEKSKDIGGSASALALPAIGAGAGGAKVAMDIDGAVRQLVSSIGATGEEARILEQDMRNVWLEGFGDNPDQVAEAMKLVKTNIKGVGEGKEFQDLTKDILTLSQLTDTDLSESTRGINQLMHNFGLTSTEALDLFAKGQQNGLNYSNEMFDNISEYAPLFKNMGYSADEYFALLQNGAENGAYNLDYVNDVMKEFQIRIKDGSKSTSDAMGEMSDSTQKVWQKFLDGEVTVKEVFQKILPELEGMDDQVKANEIGVALFGTKWEDLETDTMYALDNVNNSLKNVDGTMKDMTATQEQAFGQQFQSTMRNVGSALEPIGLILLDMLNRLSPHLTRFSDWFKNLNPVIQMVITVIGILMTVLGPLIIIFGHVVSAIAKIIPVVTKVWTWLSKLKPIFNVVRVAMLALTGPVGIVIGVIVALIAIFVTLYKKNEEFRNKVNQVWSKVKEIFSSAVSKSIEKFNELKSKMSTTASNIKTTVSEKFNAAKKAIIDPIESAKKKVGDLVEGIKGFFTKLKLKIPKPTLPKMPKFSLSTGTKTVFGKTITYPNGINVNWHKTGGVFVDPVVAGNAGFGDVEEAIVPFEGKHASRIAGLIAREQQRLSDGLANKASSFFKQAINLTVVSELDGYEVARVTYPHIENMQSDTLTNKLGILGVKR